VPAIGDQPGRKADAPKVRKVKRPVVRKVPPTPDQADRAASPARQRHRVRVTAQVVRRAERDVGRDAANARVTTPDQQDRSRPAAQRKRDAQVVAETVKQARVKVLTKRNAGSGTRAVVRELEGKGVLAKLGSAIGSSAEENVRAHGLGGRSPVTSTASSDTVPVKLAINAAKDLANFPSAAPASVYVPSAGVVEAAQGRPARLKEFAHGIDTNDPVYNAAAAAVDVVKGDTKAAKKRIRTAAKLAEEHPGNLALEWYGVGKGLDAAAGRVARTGALGKKIKTAAATEGAPKTFPGTALEQPRIYPKGPVQKVVKVHQEKTAREKARQLRAQAALHEDTNPVEAARLHSQANRADPDRIQPGEIKRRVDGSVAAFEDIRRLHRSEVINQVRAALKGVKGHAKPAVSLVAQRITHATPEDLRAYRAELEAEAKTLAPAEKASNAQLRAHITDALAHPEHLAEVEAAAQRYHDVISPLQAKLIDREMLDSEQASRASVMPYAVRRMGAKHEPEHWVDGLGKKVPVEEVRRARADDPTMAKRMFTNVPARLVGKDGKPLSTDAIRAHMAKNGVSEPAFISQAPNARGGFNIRGEVAQALSNRRRTGQATRHGTFDASHESLVENAARMQGFADATDAFRSHVSEFALRGGSGKVKSIASRKRAEELRDNLNAQGDGHKWTIVRIHPFGARREQLDALLHHASSHDQFASHAGDHSPLVGAQLDALSGTGDGPFALMPEIAAKRFQEHLSKGSVGTAGKLGQMGTSAFRRTVLSTSLPWLTGNVVEAGARSLVAHAGPRSYYTAQRAFRKLAETDPAAAEQARVRIAGGGHLSMASRQHIRTDAEQFAGTSLEGLAQHMGTFWRKPVARHAAAAWHAWNHFVFDVVNATIERQFQTAMAGKAIRSSQLMDGHLRKASAAAIEDAAQGLKSTTNQVRFGREVDKMYGRYSKLSPTERQIITLFTPFGLWAWNAARFVLDTLPRDHPVTTAVIAASENASEDWLKQHGLLKGVKGEMPAFLMGSIPVGSDGKIRLSRYFPTGLFTDPGETISGQVLPQISAVQEALRGNDWKGDPLNGRNGPEASDAQKFAAAIHALATATVPGLGLGERVAAKGPGAVNPVPVIRNKPKVTKVKPDPSSYDLTYGPGSYEGTYADPSTK
jgi:hypothetical protein